MYSSSKLHDQMYIIMTLLQSQVHTVCMQVVFVVRSYIMHINRYFKIGRERRLSWSGLWVLIMLLSTNVLNTSISILNCPYLSNSSGEKDLVCTCIRMFVYVTDWIFENQLKCHILHMVMSYCILLPQLIAHVYTTRAPVHYQV